MKELRFFLVLACVCILSLFALALVAGCSREAWRVPMAVPNDSLPLIPHLQAKKITITGPVTFITQLGTGNSSTTTATDNTKAGQRATAPAIGAGSTATATEKPAPWYVYGLLVVLLLGVGFWLHAQFPSVFSLLK